ncbi:MAG: cell division protein FtsB [Candidatus Thioglobus sp.]|nr:MAG: cell division protein FtsB [Candidatus Thioglobus sp.]RUM80917.1 MAG: cell division protein FtsB [Candidatus Thioglobus sp.]RUM81499.1 MAG: cell division protein FtsB [Candidatus Thioglobus sp.]
MFGFFYKYWATIILIVILATLLRQNFVINKFPFSLSDRQQIIDDDSAFNQSLDQKNIKMTELKMGTKSNMEILESQARYRFGFIKKGETYYQITPQDP